MVVFNPKGWFYKLIAQLKKIAEGVLCNTVSSFLTHPKQVRIVRFLTWGLRETSNLGHGRHTATPKGRLWPEPQEPTRFGYLGRESKPRPSPCHCIIVQNLKPCMQTLTSIPNSFQRWRCDCGNFQNAQEHYKNLPGKDRIWDWPCASQKKMHFGGFTGDSIFIAVLCCMFTDGWVSGTVCLLDSESV